MCSVYSVGQSWTNTPIHFIDFEGSAASGILEFGVVTLQGGTITTTRTRLCQPRGRVTAEDTAVHGLRAEALAGEAPFREEWDYFCTLRASGPLAAHFAQAEHHLLKSSWAYPQSVPDFARPGKTTVDWGPWIDTGRLYPQFHPQLGAGRLEELIAGCALQPALDQLGSAHCPVDRRHYHCALYDALAGALLLQTLLQRPEISGATIPWLLQMSTLNADRRDALQQGDLF